jgi:hypothetical protein
MAREMGGHLYMQTNETHNSIVHYRWSASGTLAEVERVPTGGAHGSARLRRAMKATSRPAASARTNCGDRRRPRLESQPGLSSPAPPFMARTPVSRRALVDSCEDNDSARPGRPTTLSKA